jgi:aminomethyltransferase
MQKDLKKTTLNSWHKEHGGQMVEFGGWEMPVAYRTGIIEEHLQTRKFAGLFDISHMGRFLIEGEGATPFLEHVLTNNAVALGHGMAHYTLIPNETGGAIDDAFLYRLDEGNYPRETRYLLVVNASNKDRDWEWLSDKKRRFKDILMEDRSEELGMLAVQGPRAKKILETLLIDGQRVLPDRRNRLVVCEVAGEKVVLTISKTGYTGEPICFELFMSAEKTRLVWETILTTGGQEGVVPVGLGARDTLRLEAGLPLYGHELGLDHDGKEIPIYAVPSARQAVSFSRLKGESIGKEALRRQFEEMKLRMDRLPVPSKEKQVVPRKIYPVAVTHQGIARQGYDVLRYGNTIGHITSGTMVPYWMYPDHGILSKPTEQRGMRAIALAYLDADTEVGDKVEIKQRGKIIEGIVVARHLSNEAPPYARPIFIPGLHGEQLPVERKQVNVLHEVADKLVGRVIENNLWRQREAVNLIPSEATPSLLVSMLTIMDPSHRYAEHRNVMALGDRDVYYYQGTKLIEEVEELISEELRRYLACKEVEIRVISGQMANAAVFSGLVDYINRLDRKQEPRRIRKVMNHHLAKGGHLSAQPMGALRDYVAHDSQTESPAVIPFPVLKEDPYQIDLVKTEELLNLHQPELIILGKSMILYREPLTEISRMISGMKPKPVILYDMAHVLGLVGPLYQEPFDEGADLITGSTHKTFFGTQRGVIASNMARGSDYEDLWGAIRRRVFPGSVSNHHLGTLVGLLMASYEMNIFKHDFQKSVIANAKAFARALNDQGLSVEGNPNVGYTETHQVILRVGHGKGPEMAYRLEENNIVLNYQSAPDDEAFTSASCLRMGVQEMTRFGMKEGDFSQLAQYMKEIIVRNRPMNAELARFRKKFTAMQYCLPESEAAPLVKRLLEAIR